MRVLLPLLIALGLASCAPMAPPEAMPASSAARLARVYYWRALPGKMQEYSRYIREVAEPIDEEARHAGAFLSVTTYVNPDGSAPWTHMRIFLLRDQAQFDSLPQALEAAGVRLEPSGEKRRERQQYSATLRERVAEDTLHILR
jgi:hypothetical protein